MIILVFPMKIQDYGGFYLAFSVLLLQLYPLSFIIRFLVLRDTLDDKIRIFHN